jgi:hypothetical protein
MKYLIVMQFIPGVDQIWVEKLNPEDPTWIFDTLAEAEVKKTELEAADPGRGYKIVTVDADNNKLDI